MNEDSPVVFATIL